MMKHLPAFAAALLLLGSPATAQDDDWTIHVTPPSLELKVGESARLEVLVVDGAGAPQEVELVFFSRSRGAVRVDSTGRVEAVRPGSFTMVVRSARKSDHRLTVEVPVTVSYAAIRSVEVVDAPERLYVGVSMPLRTRVLDEVGFERDDVQAHLVSLQPAVAAIDAFGQLTAVAAGTCVIEASAEGVVEKVDVRVEENPVRAIDLEPSSLHVRTGDVVHLSATARDADGGVVADAPFAFSFSARPDDDLAPAATGQIEPDGRFVAEEPGLYTIHASCGTVSSHVTIRADARDVQRRIKLVGRGSVQDVHTSDLWVWQGVDGRDYAVTGTWGANGEALFWDVTDPAQIERVGKVTVDARTVNDVKVSPDGTLCVISREGASDRKNGIVLIDVTDPRNPEVVSKYTDELTGGVHNLFIWNDHVFALSAGRRYDIIDISDRETPHRVGTFELETTGHSIHDVWVVDGIAYSSNWQDGVYMVDVGNGVAGGSLENPVVIGHYAYPSGWNHAAFPYHDPETGKFYVIAGDEAFPYGLNVEDKPTYPRGWLHFVDFTDPKNPKEVARYQVPEAGSHNFWVEGGVLYAAFYNGGLRVVDISGELMGDLYEQGREIGWYLPTDHEGKVPNAPMTWGPQPHKGRVFFSDWNSGLWAVELEPVRE